MADEQRLHIGSLEPATNRLCHKLFGHIPLLSNHAYADYMHEYGKGGARAREYKTTKILARLNWRTIEFGLIKNPEGLKIYGAGLCSSFGEAKYCLQNPSARHVPFDLDRCMRTRIYINDMQPIYFVIDSFESLFEQAVHTDVGPLYASFKGLGDYEQAEEYLPFDLQASDEVIREGMQQYINPKREELIASLSI